MVLYSSSVGPFDRWMCYIRALLALFDGPKDWAWPMARWGILYTSPPALSDDTGEARMFTKTVMSMARWGSLTVILLRRSCLLVRMQSVTKCGSLIYA